ncbi:hypothetical protein LNP05_29960 [Klebsiella pneumoniae subsp. pneumoniae]|nr:hypothetical protein [Klebsiella pneumoniae subsp. pneumoniae]
MDLIVFPEYSLQGLSMDTSLRSCVVSMGPEVAARCAACVEHRIWGFFSIMEANPHGNPYNSGNIVDDTGEIRLYYRKMHPWVPVEPWEPGDGGIPVCDGPRGCKLALIICHDGRFRKWRVNVPIKARGDYDPYRRLYRADPPRRGRSPIKPTLLPTSMQTASVCMCGSDGTFDSNG